MERMKEIMSNLRTNTPKEIGGLTVTRFDDYVASTSTDTATGAKTMITLPKSDVLTFVLTDGASVVIRPSGTEPKIKFYLEVKDTMKCAGCYQRCSKAADEKIEAIKKSLGLD